MYHYKKDCINLVSEFMLQQTQVATVITYFNRFIKRSLILDLYQKSKIKNWLNFGKVLDITLEQKLKKICSKIVKNFQGKLPDNFDDLISLPGIGNYTANAILAIGYNKPHVPLDGNTKEF